MYLRADCIWLAGSTCYLGPDGGKNCGGHTFGAYRAHRTRIFERTIIAASYSRFRDSFLPSSMIACRLLLAFRNCRGVLLPLLPVASVAFVLSLW